MAKILIVDDSATVRQIIMRGIRRAGILVDSFAEADNGLQGLETLATVRVDLILTDINMPNMSGLDFVKTVREEHGNDTPILMITSEGSDEIVSEANERGANGCLKKPFLTEEIQEVLRRHLP